MSRRKISFVIVEGPSDENALGVLLERSFDCEELHFHVVHGDICTQRGSTPASIVSKVAACVKDFATAGHFKPADFKRIIHIVDTDGVFISDDAVIEVPQARGTHYSLDHISCPNKDSICARNAQKSANLLRLSSTDRIWNVPYQVYYMSSNLDHVLYNKLNCSNDQKRVNALRFADAFCKYPGAFSRFMWQSPFAVRDGYDSSWEFISQGKRSLQRWSNLALCLPQPPDVADGREPELPAPELV